MKATTYVLIGFLIGLLGSVELRRINTHKAISRNAAQRRLRDLVSQYPGRKYA